MALPSGLDRRARWLRTAGWGAFAALSVVGSVAAAQAREPLPADPLLRAVIDESLAVRPELAQAQAQVQAQAQRGPQAGALPDPMVKVGVQNDGFTSWEVGRMPTSFVSLMAEQAFPWPGTLSLRRDVAELGTSVARQRVSRLRLSTEAEVRRAWLGLQLARGRLLLLDALEALWVNALGAARVRYEAGEGAQSDVLRSQLELNRLKQRRLGLGAEAQRRVQTLNRLRGHPLDEALVPPPLADAPAPTALQPRFSVDDALARSPELAAARLDTGRAEVGVALAQKAYFPDLVVGGGLMLRGGALPPMWQLTVGGTLPIFAGEKQSHAESERRAQALAATREADAIAQVVRLRSSERAVAFTATLETLAIYQQGLLVQSRATAESTLAQYRVGRVTFVSVMEANAGLIADQDAWLRALADAYGLLIDEEEVSLAAVSGAGDAGPMGAAMPNAAPPAAADAAPSPM